jgi:hypothetical protein
MPAHTYRQWNGTTYGGKSAFELDVTFGHLLSLRSAEALSHDVTQHLLHRLHAISLRQLVQVSTQVTGEKQFTAYLGKYQSFQP